MNKQGKDFCCLGFPEFVSWKFLRQNYLLYLNNDVSTVWKGLKVNKTLSCSISFRSLSKLSQRRWHCLCNQP